MPTIPLGPFELSEVIGTGGMGQVWKGTHRTQGIAVAVKVVGQEHLGDDRRLRAFTTEVRATAGLDHPSIVKVFDFGTVGDDSATASGGELVAGSPYLAMELAEGGSLWPMRGRLRWRELWSLLSCLLDALAHAHARGVVHRDLKPGNVLLGLGGGRPGPKITDFGLAHAVGEAGSERRTQGTPAYMAPEQFGGVWREQGPWTDLYGLGCLAWTMCTGKRPFVGATTMDLRMAHSGRAPPAFEPTSPVPEGFEAWLRRLLEKRPEDRFTRAADAAWALHKLGLAEGSEPPSVVNAQLDDEPLSTQVEPSTLTFEPMPEAPAPGRVMRVERPRLPRSWRQPSVRRSRQFRDAGLGIYDLQTVPMVGRDHERDRLWANLQRVCSGEGARVVVLRGPAGCGKTRLAQWLGERAHEVGAAEVMVALHTRLSGPVHGLGAMLRRWLHAEGLDGAHLERRAARVLTAWGVQSKEAPRALCQLIAPRDYEQEEGPIVRFSAPRERHVFMKRLFCAVGRRRPVVLHFDDVQWATDALAFARHLAEQGDDVPALVLCTLADEALEGRDAEDWFVRDLADKDRVETLHLGALPQEHRKELVRELVSLEPGLASRVEKRTQGNPLFAVQLVGDWVARGLLEPGPKGFRLREGADVDLPRDLWQVWGARINRILLARPKQDRLALELAAVLGQEVDHVEWAAACEAAGIEPALSLVELLLGQRLAVELEHANGWAFVHGMLRESLERSARSGGRWASHHRSGAEMLRALGRTGQAHAERLARHLLGAGDREGALDPLTTAIRRHIAANEFHAADALLAERERVLAALELPESDERYGQGWVMRARASVLRSDYTAAEHWAGLVLKAGVAHGWRRSWAGAMRELGLVHRLKGELERSRLCLDEAHAGAVELGDQQLAASCVRERGDLLVIQGRLGPAKVAFAEALAAFEALADVQASAQCHLGLGTIAKQQGELTEAALWFARAREGFAVVGSRWGEADCHVNLGELARLGGRLGEAETWYRKAQLLYQAIGALEGVLARLNLGLTLTEQGRYAESRRELEGCLTEMEEWGRRSMVGCVCALMMPSLARLGAWEELEVRLATAEKVLGETRFVDLDIARMAEAACRTCIAEGKRALARRTGAMALRQWNALGRDAERAALTQALTEVLV